MSRQRVIFINRINPIFKVICNLLHFDFIDIDFVMNNSLAGKSIIKELGEINKSSQNEFKKIEKYVGDHFCLTYGDGLTSANIKKTIILLTL